MRQKISRALITIFIIAIAFNGCSKDEKLKIGYKAPNFSLLDINDKVNKLSDYKGKLIVLRFWQKGCPSCLTQMPALSKFYKKHKDRINILAINMGNSKEFVAKFANDSSISYPMLRDELKIATQKYKVTGSPTTFIIDKNGILKDKLMGKMEDTKLLKVISSYL